MAKPMTFEHMCPPQLKQLPNRAMGQIGLAYIVKNLVDFVGEQMACHLCRTHRQIEHRPHIFCSPVFSPPYMVKCISHDGKQINVTGGIKYTTREQYKQLVNK